MEIRRPGAEKERWATSHGCIMKIDLAKSRGVVGQRKNVLRSDWEEEYAKGQS